MNGFNYITQNIKSYINQFPIEENDLQKKMRQQAIKDKKESWIIPVEVGQFFYILAKITKAQSIYEIGSYLGYSATWFSKGMSENGKIILTENNEHRYKQAQNFLQSSSYLSKIEIRNSDAHDDLKNERNLFDIILIDHDKPNYSHAFKIAKQKIKRGGFIIADNVLWRGRVVNPKFTEKDTDNASTAGILAFNELIMNDNEVTSLIIPIGDGISISIFK